jgi:hypothetical protein
MQLGGYGGSTKGTNVKTSTWGEKIEKRGKNRGRGRGISQIGVISK